jgi:hypothetical protein
MTEENPLPHLSQRICPRCSAKFTCGLAAMEAACWCFEMPNVITASITSRQGCLCPNCLQKLIESIQAKQAIRADNPY